MCAKAKTHPPPKSQLGETTIATKHGEIFYMDIVTGLKRTKRNNQYILSIIDSFSNMCWLHALETMTATEVAEKLLVTISQSGVPNYMITDLQSSFIGNVMSHVYHMLGIKKLQSLAYMARSHGRNERLHRTMSATIRCLLLEFPDKSWDDLLSMVEQALRSSVDTSSQLSPLDIWTGRQVRLPADMAYNVEDPISSVTSDEYIKGLRRRLEIMYKIQQDARATCVNL